MYHPWLERKADWPGAVSSALIWRKNIMGIQYCPRNGSMAFTAP